MGVGSLVLTAMLLTILGFATAVFDHSRQLRRAHRRPMASVEAATPAAAAGSEPPG
ncbi:hypothetical protein [Candidatus Nephthysia bennettiae]|uniref:hypothetical protein n=1 Tax=Candidatus Nephthysia bennettiae TaxID=3127016 RepID=UPI001A2F9830|nr:hypothetical protein [Candidatus Dormibacteraeota bacterium]